MSEDEKLLQALREWRACMVKSGMIDTTEAYDLGRRHYRKAYPNLRTKIATRVFRVVKDD